MSLATQMRDWRMSRQTHRQTVAPSAGRSMNVHPSGMFSDPVLAALYPPVFPYGSAGATRSGL